MTAFQVTAALERIPAAKDELEQMGDSLMEALLDAGVLDPAVSVTSSESTIEIEMTMEATKPADALQMAQDIVHQALTAVHLSLVTIRMTSPMSGSSVGTARRQGG